MLLHMRLNSDITTLIALFAIVSPITSIPVFLSLTSGATKEKRRVIAMQTALVSGLTLFIAYFIGDVILKLLQYSNGCIPHCRRARNWRDSVGHGDGKER